MNYFSKFIRSSLSSLFVILLAGVLVVSAAAPLGGYLPGATLDPSCVPGTTDCIVQASVFPTGGTAGQALVTNGAGVYSWASPAPDLSAVTGAANINTTGAIPTTIGNALSTTNIGGPFAVTGNQTNSGNLIVNGTTTLNGNSAVTGTNTFTVGTGATTLGGTLGVTGVTTLTGAQVLIGNTDLRGSLSDSTGNLTINDTVDISGGLNVTGNQTNTGDLAVNGGDITTTAGTASLFNTGATTLNIGGAATTVSLGASTGLTTVNNNLSVAGTSAFTGASTFTLAPTVTAFSTAGVVHNDASGNLTTSLIVSGDITDGTILNADIANGTIDLTTKVTGILPVANGGTGLATIPTNSIIIGNGTGTPTTLTGAAGQLLSLGVGGVPAYSDPNDLFVFHNGLTESGVNNVVLGGSLDQNTTLNTGAFNLLISGTADFSASTASADIYSTTTTKLRGDDYVVLSIAATPALTIGGSGGGVRDIQIHNYASTRSDATTPANFLYTDASGNLLSGPISALTSNNIGLTAGSVAFVNALGGLTQDNSNFFFNDTTNRLGIGNNTPTEALDVTGNVRFSGALMPGNQPGTAPGTGANGFDGNPTTTQQLLTSRGAGAVPTWDTYNFELSADARIALQKATNNGIASLDGTGQIPTSQIPSTVFSDTFVKTQLTGGGAGTNCTDLASANQGDICTTTAGGTYVLTNNTPGTAGNWQLLLSVAPPVSSVNSQIGNVTLTADNGLNYATATQAQLGGTLLHDTEIDLNGSYFAFTGTPLVGIGMTPGEALDVSGNVQFTGALMPGSDAGTTGQLLVSAGAGAAPTWINNPLAAGTAAGQTKYWDGSNWVNLNIGTAGQILQVNGGATAPSWVTPATAVTSLNGLTVATQTLAVTNTAAAQAWTSAGSAHTLNLRAWDLTGNSGTTAGTNFLGTTDGQPLVFKTNSAEAMRILTSGNVGIGATVPGNKLEITHGTAGSSGLRFTNMLSTSSTTAANGKSLTVNATGDVILSPNGGLMWYAENTTAPATLPTATGTRSIAIGTGAVAASADMFVYGNSAGSGATAATNSNFFGSSAGNAATNAQNSNFIGNSAGLNATNAQRSNFIGQNAGNGATNSSFSNFIGYQAGITATDAYYSNFIGRDAGYGATGAFQSNFIGLGSGTSATGASNSNFLGNGTGSNATNATNSNFFGQNAGNGATSASGSNFFGNQAGISATGASDSNFFSQNAGYGATGAYQTNFFGRDAGNGATGAFDGNFLGYQAGYGATGAYRSNFFGPFAGRSATGAFNTNFFGPFAGDAATNASASNFFGQNAGQNATGADNSNFYGNNAGNAATGAQYANFFGFEAGKTATTAPYSNFFGYRAGYLATNATNSIFIGTNTGSSATNAARSIFIGDQAGGGSTVNTTTAGDWSILIGNNTATSFKNSIALGKGATNSAVNQFMIGSGTAQGGVNTMILNATNANTCTVDVLGGTGLACTSDERRKTNIADLSNTDTLDKLTKIRTVSYNWIAGDTSKNNIGFLAQDIEQYFPEVVMTDQSGYKAVSYGNMTPMIISAIKQLNLKVDTAVLSTGTTGVGDTLKSWLGDVTNGLEKVFTKRLETNKFCITDESGTDCYTREQINRVLGSSPESVTTPDTSGTSSSGAPSDDTTTVSSDTGTDTTVSVDDTSSSSDTSTETPASDTQTSTPDSDTAPSTTPESTDEQPSSDTPAV